VEINTPHSQLFTITNTGGSTLTISEIRLGEHTGSTLQDDIFTITDLGQLPINLNGNQATTFTVVYLPTSAGEHSANVVISDNTSGFMISLTGISVDPTFNPPQNLTATAGIEVINLAWQPPVAGSSGFLTGFKIQRDGVEMSIGMLDANIFNYSDQSVVYPESYTYCVTAIYASPEGESIASNTTLPIAPLIDFLPVQNLIGSVNSQTVTLNWSAPNSQYVTSYRVYRNEVPLSTVNVPNISYAEANVPVGTHIYSVIAIYPTDESSPANIEVTVDPVSDTDEVLGYVKTELLGNYPNPFNPETVIKFGIGNAESTPPLTTKTQNPSPSPKGHAEVRIDIYNIKGVKVKTLVNRGFNPGIYEVVWNGTDDGGHKVGSGVYFYRMRVGDYVGVRRMMLLK
jgi:hypothetical protein